MGPGGDGEALDPMAGLVQFAGSPVGSSGRPAETEGLLDW